MPDQAQLYTTKLASPYTFTLDVLAVHGISEPDHIQKFPGLTYEFADGTLAEAANSGRRCPSIEFNVMSSSNLRRAVLWWLDPARKIITLMTAPGVFNAVKSAGGSLSTAVHTYTVSAIDVVGEGPVAATDNDTPSGSDLSMSLNWSAISGARSYKIYRKIGAGNWFLLDYATGLTYIDDGSVTPLKDLGVASPPSSASEISVITTNEFVLEWRYDTELCRIYKPELRETSVFTAAEQFPV